MFRSLRVPTWNLSRVMTLSSHRLGLVLELKSGLELAICHSHRKTIVTGRHISDPITFPRNDTVRVMSSKSPTSDGETPKKTHQEQVRMAEQHRQSQSVPSTTNGMALLLSEGANTVTLTSAGTGTGTTDRVDEYNRVESPHEQESKDNVAVDIDVATVPSVTTRMVYIHPLSQIVLLYFQTSCHEWICRRRLDTNLTLHRDGTFTLEQEPSPTWSTTLTSASSGLRIWTYYDAQERSHLLMVSVNQVRHQFLLQDNRLTAWQGFKRRSLPERIQEAIHDAMDAVDELD